MKILKALFIILIAAGIAVLGLVLIAIPTTGLDGQSINNGFQILQTMDVIGVFSEPGIITVKIGVALAVFAAPIIGLIGIIRFVIRLFK